MHREARVGLLESAADLAQTVSKEIHLFKSSGCWNHPGGSQVFQCFIFLPLSISIMDPTVKPMVKTNATLKFVIGSESEVFKIV